MPTAEGAFTVKFAVDEPEFTVTDAGTVAFPLLLCSDTLVLLVAFPLNVTVHVEDAGGVTLAGLQLKLDNTIAGVRVRVNGFEVEPRVAVITAEACELTAVVVTVKFAVDEPEFTVTDAGTVAFPLLLCSDTLVLLVAFPLNVTVHVEDAGGVTLAGLQLKLDSTIACVRVSVNGFEVEPRVAVIIAEACELTAVVVTVKFAVDEPEFTVTDAGTVAFPLLLCSDTLVLLVAFPLNVTVHVEDVGGVTLAGLQLKLDNTIAGVRVRVNGFEVEPSVAVITAEACVVTAVVVTVKFAVDEPEFTVTDAGTVAFPLLLCSDTLVLLVAFPLNVTVHVEDVGGVTLAGLQLKLDSTTAGVRVKVNGFEVEPSVAVITAEACVVTAVVVTVKFAVDEPEFTVTVPGTVAFPLLLCSDTLVLLVAFPLNVTVHVEDVGGVTLAGLQLKLDNTIAGVRVRVNGFEVEPSVAVITAEACELTVVVVTVKFAVDEPEFTVTDAGTVAFPLLLCSDTLVLLVAFPLNVTVHVEDVGGVTLAGLQLKLDSTTAGVRVKVNGFEVEPSVAVITAEACVVTAVVVTVKFAVDEPEFTVTVPGTVAFPLLLCSDTLVLLVAFPLNVTVHVEDVGGVTLAGLQLKLDNTIAGVRVRVNGFEVEPSVAVITAEACELTVVVVTVKFAVDEPEFTVTDAGTVAFPLLLCSDTLVLLVAFPLNVTVHVEDVGGVTLAGLQLKLDSTTAGVRVKVNGFEVEPSVAVITAEACVVTAVVVTVKFAVDEPEFTVTVPGTVAFPLLLCSDTLVLLVAFPLNVTVHVEDVGGVTLAGLQLKLDNTIAGVRVRVNGFEVEPSVAVITAEACELTVVVVTVKFAVDEPEFTVTDAGTVAFPLLLCSDTLVLLVAFPLNVTVHVEDVGGVTLAGLQLKLDSTTAGVRVNVNGFEVEPNVAVITAEACELTAVVVTVKFAVDDPEFTVTVPGTVAFPLLLCNDTLVLLVAFPLNVTVHVEDVGGVKPEGLQLRPVRVTAAG